MSTEIPSLADVMKMALSSALGKLHTSYPARVLSYDSDAQKAVVQSVVRFRRMLEDGTIETYLPPPVAGVPVLFVSSANFSITFPIAAEDHGFVIVAERSTDEWRSNGRTDNDPRDPRRFDVSDSFFLPAGRPFSNPIPPSGIDDGAIVIAGDMKLGSSGAVKAVALEPDLKAYLDSLKLSFDTHTHTDPISGTTGPPLAPSPSVPNFASSRVKAE